MRFQKNNPMRLFYGALFMGVFAIGISACSKENALGDRFSLTNFNGAMQMVHADTSVTFSWLPALTAWEGDRPAPEVSYEIMIAKSADFSNEDAITVIQDSLTFTIGKERLTPLVNYYARIRTVSAPGIAGSSWIRYTNTSNVPTFRVLSEISYFKTIIVGDVIDVAARLRWTPNSPVTNLVLSSGDGSPSKTIVLSDDEKKNGLAVVTGLIAGKDYRVELFLVDEKQNSFRRGTQSFKTKEDVNGAGYTDLRGSTDPAILVNTLPTAAAGTKIVLKRGMKYTLSSTYEFARSVTIMSEPGFGEPAQIEMTSSFTMGTLNSLDFIKFEDVSLTGNSTARDNGGTVFNVQSSRTVGKIVFENCIISGHRGVARIRTGSKVDSLIINNCQIKDIGDYGISNVSDANANVTDIKISNSTIVNAYRIVVATNRNTNYDRSVAFENLTLHKAPGESQYLVAYNNGSVTNPTSITNCLIDPVLNARGFQGRNLSFVVSNSFLVTNMHATNGAIAGLLSSGKTTSQVFVNADAGDFTIKEPALITTGDPRWRP